MDRPEPKLSRRLSVSDAVVIGLGSMLGAGVFVAISPASAAAGGAMIYGILIAGLVAYLNATSSAQLAALYPQAGGTYVYAKHRLGELWGTLAGWAFVSGKIASCAAIALTFASYASPRNPRLLAFIAVTAVTAVNYLGVRKTVVVTWVVVAFVVSALAAIAVGLIFGGPLDGGGLGEDLLHPSPSGVLRSAGLMFFAFAGYARIATLGEEVIEPTRSIPRAIPLALGITVVIYLFVTTAALVAVGSGALAASSVPLADAISAGRFSLLVPLVRLGASIASLGVLLSLVAGISRTLFAMARDKRVPSFLAAVHPRYGIPHRADVLVGIVTLGLVAVTNVHFSIGLSAFTVLVYYAITNASAWTLKPSQRLWPRPLAGLGLIACIGIAFMLPLKAVAVGSGAIAMGALFFMVSTAATRRR